ncbi:uncharacterized protein K460DRAFT_363973 [Cucurbitaria berberidis CBS 394.84]|uniref:Uncharacterized protein n=1 Tax=Cucurbitaria berberidis CBS 394.84 TaxID=1168544 RepID=A0A9P4GKF7_9PLEO|nr:uncharacterized protein K460DRAFT_363973 [Cucurbitaria berberidis CBS 394.84]KAF1847963.1 hypothetical protein K460DRAFT_363973 [Cucurbitaria berberidis CBS 394.84]
MFAGAFAARNDGCEKSQTPHATVLQSLCQAAKAARPVTPSVSQQLLLPSYILLYSCLELLGPITFSIIFPIQIVEYFDSSQR